MKVARWPGVVWWWRIRYGHATAERHLDVLASAMGERGWVHLKIYVEWPPTLWVFAKGHEGAALSVTANRVDGRWVYEIWRSIEYPCHAVEQVANFLDDVLRDRTYNRSPVESGDSAQ